MQLGVGKLIDTTGNVLVNLLICISLVSLVTASNDKICTTGICVINGTLGEPLPRVIVNSATEYIFYIPYKFDLNQTWAIRVNVESRQATTKYPVLFVVRQERGILSWQVPLLLDSSQFMKVGRTLCPLQNYQPSPESGDQNLYIDVSTASMKDVTVSVSANITYGFVGKIGEEKSETVTPSEPIYYEYNFPLGVNSLLIHVTSHDDQCMVVSVQKIDCPIFDLDHSVEFNGFYQTMGKQAGISVTRQNYPKGKFYVVLALKVLDYDCAGIETIRPSQNYTRSKNVKITVTPKITQNEYYAATFGALAVFLLFYIFSIAISAFYLIKERRNPSERSLLESQAQLIMPLHSSNIGGYGTMSASRVRHHSTKEPNNMDDNNSATTSASTTDSVDGDTYSLDETEVDMLHDADHEKDVFRTKTFLYVADLSRKSQKKLSKKSKLYYWNLLTIAVFYGVPVVQLVYTYQTVLHVTGNQDICYYNFICSHPLGVFSDFNHVFSNIGYLLLGFLFLGLVWRRDLLYQHQMALNPRLRKYFGIPSHFGLFYAMGLALMMEGVLSGCYHVCPNYSNFQFDTAFMYMIAGLCMLKIYQTRHPDINANSHSTYLTFAIILLIGVLGVLNGSPYFWIGFAVIHILSCLLLSIQIYYMGRWKLNIGIFKRIYLTLRNDLCTHFTRPMYPDRLSLLILANCFNWGLLAYGLSTRPKDFASFLLAIFITNLLLYAMFYIIMKLRYREQILFLPMLYIFLSTLTWGAGLYFFMQKNVSWQKTPAQSRDGNRPCVILHFYDDHDVWHFLSSAALFLSFMTLLTLDDDLVNTPRDKIPVF